MGLTDRGGNAVSARSGAAVAASEQALWRMMSFYDTPLDDLDAAIAADPAWCLPHAMKAGFLAGLTEPALLAEATAHLEAATTRAERDGNARERAHVDAVRAAIAGDWQAAGDRWAGVSAQHPRDALALQWGHLFDFHRGDAASLAARIERALPAWRDDDAWRPHVLAMHAFGLEELGRYDEAEAEARAALAAEARAPWAIHAVAHCMEMQGRFAEGRAWLDACRAAWGAGDNGFAAHLGWHEALFALEALDLDGVFAAYDRYLAAGALEVTLQRLDAASILWRLMLRGVDVRDRFVALLASWPLEIDRDAGRSTFNDLHAVLAFVGAGDVARARAWAAAAAVAARRGGAWNRAVMRERGEALLGAVVAFGDGRFDEAARTLAEHAPGAGPIGGSHAQRDVLAQTMLAASARSAGAREVGRAAARARRRARPTPFSAGWSEAFA